MILIPRMFVVHLDEELMRKAEGTVRMKMMMRLSTRAEEPQDTHLNPNPVRSQAETRFAVHARPLLQSRIKNPEWSAADEALLEKTNSNEVALWNKVHKLYKLTPWGILPPKLNVVNQGDGF